jgi:Ulp1 family protease
MDEFTNIPSTFNLSLNDVRSIYHDEWLTNFLIDYILNYMVANVANSSSSFTLISSVVFLKIINNYLDNIQAYLKNTSNIDHLDGILLPCLLKNHWILAVFR